MLRKINILLNPFDVVRYNSDDQPDSRSLHTSFWEKMVDTYRVFRGESHADNVRAAEIRIRTNMMAKVMSEHITMEAFERLGQLEQEGLLLTVLHKVKASKEYRVAISEINSFRFATRPGLVDYLSLGSFRMVHAIRTAIMRARNSEVLNPANYSGLNKAGIYVARLFTSFAFQLISMVDTVCNQIVRPLVSGVAALALSPVVLFSHFVTQGVRTIKEHLLAEKMQVVYSVDHRPNTTCMLERALADAKKGFGDLELMANESKGLTSRSDGVISEDDTILVFGLHGKCREKREESVETNYSRHTPGSLSQLDTSSRSFSKRRINGESYSEISKIFKRAVSEDQKQLSQLIEVNPAVREKVLGETSCKSRYRA